MKINFDIDIDLANRDQLLALITHTPARLDQPGRIQKHNTGIYVTQIARDPITGLCAWDYQTAQDLGYLKIDILNNHVYQKVKSDQHLESLLAQTPPWHRLTEPEFVSEIVHIGNHWNTLSRLREPITTLDELAMFLALIRPAKRHLVGLTWQEIRQTIWTPPRDDSYYYKRAHAVSYAHLVAVDMILRDQSDTGLGR